MSIWDIIKEEYFNVGNGNTMPTLIARKPKIPGNPLDNIKDAVNPLKIAERKFFGVPPEEVENKFNKGDHLYTQRMGYTHHGIYIGYGKIIHYLEDGIHEDSLFTFANGYNIDKKYTPAIYDCEKIVERAYSRVGEDNYCVLWENCEQFSMWCRNGN